MKIDHWLWCARGLQGIVGMLTKLAAAKIPASTEAIAELNKHFTELQRVIQAATKPELVQSHENHNPDR